MKVLFVCRSNVGRSQMAASFYNYLYGQDADSAGIAVYEPGQKLKERLDGTTQTILAAMREAGIDMSENIRTQVSKTMLAGYDRIVIISEPIITPDWLRDHPKAEQWNVVDPVRFPLAEMRLVRDEIKQKVLELHKDS